MVMEMAIHCRVSSRRAFIFPSETQPLSARSSSLSSVSSISFKQPPIFEVNSAFGFGHKRRGFSGERAAFRILHPGKKPRLF
jgi:hypothetical protein